MIILASTSPRRQELLKEVINDFICITPNYQEEHLNHLSPERQVQNLAVNKALSIDCKDDDIIISGDTVVVYKDELLEKPIDLEDAFKMLKRLNGQTHSVLTSLCVMSNNKTVIKIFVSEVTMKQVSDEHIKKYLELHQPLDKAGSYGIQDKYFNENLLETYSGYLNTIIGFPIEELEMMIKEVSND